MAKAYFRMRVSRTVLVIVTSLSSVYGISQSNSKPDTMHILQEWVVLESGWGKPNLQPIPGSSLKLVEKLRDKGPDGRTLIHYNFKVSGLPTNDTYIMEYWQVGGPTHPFQKVASGLRINKDGLVVCGPQMTCGDRKQPEYPLEVFLPAALGEPHRYVLSSEKNAKTNVTAIAIPFPIRSTDGTCQLDIVRITPMGELLLFTGSGFTPNAAISFQGDSAGEKKLTTIHTNQQGEFQSAELPSVAGKDSGIFQLTATDDASCKPSISTKWGKDSPEIR
jgi:hypothetical protein